MTINDVIGKAMTKLDEVTSSNLTANSADYINKIFPSIDTIQTEIATNIKPIEKYLTVDSIDKKINVPEDCFKFLKVYDTDYNPINFRLIDSKVILDENGTYILYYNKYPEKITSSSPLTTELEIDKDCQEALVYGLCAELCINDEPELYDTYLERYNTLLINIINRIQSNTIARIVGGFKI